MRASSSRAALLAYASLALVILFWSGNFIVGRAVIGNIPPFTLAFVRWLGATLILLPFAWRHLREDSQVLLARWKIILLLGLIGVAGFNGFLYLGLNFTTASNSALLQAATPALVILFDRLFFAERASRLRILGVLLSISGALYTLFRGQLQSIAMLRFNSGDILILAAMLSWALYTSLLRLRPHCHPLSFLASTFVIAMLTMAPLSMYEIAASPHALSLTPDTLAAFAYVAIFPSLLAYILYNAAVAKIGAVAAGQTITLMPIVGALLAALLLGEALHSYHFIGMALILLGIAVGGWTLFKR